MRLGIMMQSSSVLSMHLNDWNSKSFSVLQWKTVSSPMPEPRRPHTVQAKNADWHMWPSVEQRASYIFPMLAIARTAPVLANRPRTSRNAVSLVVRKDRDRKEKASQLSKDHHPQLFLQNKTGVGCLSTDKVMLTTSAALQRLRYSVFPSGQGRELVN